jgi:hypothetical protein
MYTFSSHSLTLFPRKITLIVKIGPINEILLNGFQSIGQKSHKIDYQFNTVYIYIPSIAWFQIQMYQLN